MNQIGEFTASRFLHVIHAHMLAEASPSMSVFIVSTPQKKSILLSVSRAQSQYNSRTVLQLLCSEQNTNLNGYLMDFTTLMILRSWAVCK